jgi:hypothetical protein
MDHHLCVTQKFLFDRNLEPLGRRRKAEKEIKGIRHTAS